MVAADARRQSVGTALCRFALEWARERGYGGMQFNAVAETNRAAVELYAASLTTNKSEKPARLS